MQISKRTKEILNNFNKINQTIMLSDNKILRQKFPGKDHRLIAMAQIEEDFPNFMIHNLSDFLEILTAIGDDANLEFSDTDVLISSVNGNRKFKFKASPASMEDEDLKKMRENNIFDIPTKAGVALREIYFTLDTDSITSMLKVTSSIPKTNPHSHSYSFYGDGQYIYLSLGRVINDDNSHEGNVYDEILGETTENFRLDLDVNTLRMMNGKYKACIKWSDATDTARASGILSIQTEDGSLKYWNTFQSTSVFPATISVEDSLISAPPGDACGVTRGTPGDPGMTPATPPTPVGGYGIGEPQPVA